MNNRPTCINHGCNKPVFFDGKRWRPVCSHCHKAGYGARKFAEGVTPFRTGICSNINGHLGFECYMDWKKINKAKVKIKTHIDHIDGNCMNNVLENVQELCETCHSIKSVKSGDYSGFRY